MFLLIGFPIVLDPSFTHLNGSGPFAVHSLALLLRDFGSENRTVFTVNTFKFLELLPNIYGETCRNCGSQRRCLSHGRPVNRNVDEIGLSLE